MPIVTRPAAVEPQKPAAPAAPPKDESVDSLLFTKDGALTVVGQVVESFLLSLDYSDLLSEEALADLIESKEVTAAVFRKLGVAVEVDETEIKTLAAKLKELGEAEKKDKGDKDKKDGKDADDKDGDDKDGDEDDGDEDDGDEDDEKDESIPSEVGPVTVESLAGEIAAELIDEDDLHYMFLHFAQALPEKTLAEKVTKAELIKAMELSEEELVEFKRGDFTKLRRTPQGKNKVSRMLLAMLAKQVIARTKPGQVGYRAPGAKTATYTKAGQTGAADALNTTGKAAYGSGTPGGKKKYLSYVGKNVGKSAAGAAKSGEHKTAADIAKSLKRASGGSSMKAAAKSGADLKKAKAAVIAKRKPSEPGDKKSLVAHDDSKPKHPPVNESVRMAGAISRNMTAKPITESAPAAPAEKPAATAPATEPKAKTSLHEGASLASHISKSLAARPMTEVRNAPGK